MTDTLGLIFFGTSIALLALGLAMAGRLSGRTGAEQRVKASDPSDRGGAGDHRAS